MRFRIPRSFIRTLTTRVGTVAAVFGLILLATMVWQGTASTWKAERQEICEAAEGATEQLDFFVRSAETTADSVERAARQPAVSGSGLREVLERSLSAFEQHPALSYIGITLPETGEYGTLERTAAGEILLWLHPGDRRTDPVTRNFLLTDKGFSLHKEHPADGYDPRKRPFYQAALEGSAEGMWMPGYSWVIHAPVSERLWGFTYVKALRDDDGKLLCVLDTDFDVPALNGLLKDMVSKDRFNIQVIELGSEPRLIGDPDVVRMAPLPVPDSHTPLLGFSGEAFAGKMYIDHQSRWAGARLLKLKGGVSWLVVVSRKDSVIAAPLRSQLFLALGIGGAALAGLMLVSVRTARRMGKPLTELERWVAGIGKPQGPVIPLMEMAPDSAIHEFRETQLLADGLKHMTFAIREREGQLAEERRQLMTAEQELRQERDFSDAVLDGLPSVFYQFAQDGRFLRWNGNFELVTGYSAGELSSMRAEDFFSVEDRKRVALTIAEVFHKGEAQVEADFVLKDGRSIPYLFTGRRFEKSGIVGYVGVGFDLTERKQIEVELRQERDFSHAVLDGLPGVFYQFQYGGRFLRWNKHFERVSGYDAKELSSMRALDFFAVEDKERVAAKIVEAYETGASEIKTDFLLKDGRRIPYLFIGRRFDKGSHSGYVGIGLDLSERKLAEEKLKEQDNLLANAQSIAQMGIWVLDSRSKRLHWSDATCRIFGIQPEKFRGTFEHFHSVLVPEDQEKHREPLEGVTPDAPYFELEYRIRRPDGEIRWIYERGSAEYDKDGRERRRLGMAMDITERKRMEEDLREKTALFEAQVESSPDGILVVDRWGKKIIQNQRLNDQWNIPPHIARDSNNGPQIELVLSKVKDPESVSPAIADVVDNDSRATARGEVELLDGTVLERYSAPVIDKEGGYFGRLWIFREITERRRMEDSLREKTALFEAQVESSPDGILVTDNEGRKVIQNQRLTEQWDLPPNLATGEENRPQQEFAASQTTDPAAFAARIAWLQEHPEMISRDEIEFTNGKILDRYSAPVLGEGGRHYGRTWIHRDITEERHRERRLAEALSQEKSLSEKARAADHAKGEFLAMMSHEIRNPLNGILGFAELLNMAPGLSTEAEEYARIIIRSGEALLRLLDDILNYSRLESGHATISSSIFEPRTLLDDLRILLSPQAADAGLELIVSCSPEVAEKLEGDVGRIRQVVLNLATNALKFTEKGSVHITLARLGGSLGYHVFSVIDTGRGIPEDKFDHVFQPFTQIDSSSSRSHGGAGLGLAICRRLAGLLGGSLTVNSQLGKGSDFQFMVPLQNPITPGVNGDVPDQPITAHDAGFAAKHPLRIAIVEDDNINLKLIGRMLRHLGYEPLTCGNGREAVALYQRESPDFFLMDLNMPEMDGIEATREIRSLERASNVSQPARIAALTANTMPADRQRCFEVGMNDYLNKPVNITALAKVLADASDAMNLGLKRSEK